jgi:hypothetical protein
MTPRRASLVAVALASAVLACPPASAQSTSVDIEAGYQWVDVTGNEDMYRTQIDQDDGFVLRELSINYVDPTSGGFVDSLRIDASGFGGNPAGRFRLWMGKGTSYRLHVFYHQFDNFSALPAFANPMLDEGVIPGQHVWDRERHVLDVELQILPNRTVTPVIGYRWNQIEGPRQTTYHVGQDEFRLDSELEETEQEIYGGVLFATSRWSGSLLQGWRTFDGTDHVRLAAGAGAGNNLQQVLGTDVTLDDLERRIETEAETPVTTASLRGRLGERARVIASYVRADYDSETSSSELLSGSLVSFQLRRFFSGLDQSIASRTESPAWRGEARVELDLSDEIRLDLGYEARERELEGWAMISSLYLDTLNFSGADPGDISTLIDARNGYSREDEVVSARLNLRGVGPFLLWAEGARRSSDIDISEDVSQIVTPGGQQGEFEREVDVVGAGVGVVFGDSRFTVDVVNESADEIVMRTDFNDRLRLRGRFDWSISRFFRVLAMAERITASNGSSGVDYEADTDHLALDLDITPTDSVSLRLAYDGYTTDTSVPIRVPSDFSIVASEHTEDGELLEGQLRWRISRFDLELGYSEFTNDGSFAFDITRAFAGIGFDFTDSFGAAVEYETNEYNEDILRVANYDAERIAVFLRWRH